MLFILFIFHFEISGYDYNDEQPLNKQDISVTLFVFYFEISGNDSNELQSLNKYDILLTLLVFYFEISGIVIKDEQF